MPHRLPSLFVCLVALFIASCTSAPAPTSLPPTITIPDPTQKPVQAATEAPALEPTLVPTDIPPTPTSAPEPTAEASNESSADANVEFVRVVATGENIYTFHVTLEHPDTGWEDYTDGWDVVLPDGTVVKPSPGDPFTRLLAHPHVNEQPFTRSQSRIEIPGDVSTVTVRAHDLVDGFGGVEVVVDLMMDSGERYSVER